MSNAEGERAAPKTVQCYFAGRKALKAPDGNTYPVGDYVPDAHLFPNLELLLSRGRLRPGYISPEEMKRAQKEAREQTKEREKAERAARKKSASEAKARRKEQESIKERAKKHSQGSARVGTVERPHPSGGQLPVDEVESET